MSYSKCCAKVSSPISRLPPELRTLVFEGVFGVNEPGKLPIVVTWRYKENRDGSKKLRMAWTAPKWVGNVFEVCRLWRIEASQIFFTKNYFLLGLSRSRCAYQSDLNVDLGTKTFARRIGHANIHSVTSMAVKMSSWEILGNRKWIEQGVWYKAQPGRVWIDRVLRWIKKFPRLRQFRVVCADIGCSGPTSCLGTAGKSSLPRREIRRVLEEVVVLIEYKRVSQGQIQQPLKFGVLPLGPPSTYRLVWKDYKVVVEQYQQSSWRSLYLDNDGLRRPTSEDEYPNTPAIRDGTEFYYAE